MRPGRVVERARQSRPPDAGRALPIGAASVLTSGRPAPRKGAAATAIAAAPPTSRAEEIPRLRPQPVYTGTVRRGRSATIAAALAVVAAAAGSAGCGGGSSN